MRQSNDEFVLSVNNQELGYIMGVLSARPFAEVEPLILKIRKQIAATAISHGAPSSGTHDE